MIIELQMYRCQGTYEERGQKSGESSPKLAPTLKEEPIGFLQGLL